MKKDLLSIYCPNCGAPAKFDIEKQSYFCGYCDSEVRADDVISQNKEMKAKITEKLEETASEFSLETAICGGCGAALIFEANEALSNCEFCGRSVVREKYTGYSEMPQSVIPFALTREEATEKLAEWCEQNKDKNEAAKLQAKLTQLKGYYLPYQLVRGEVKCTVKKKGDSKGFYADGYLNDEFVNCSKQLDNLVLDAMEPYDLTDLKEFDFAYVAGQRVKISDITEDEIRCRLHEETSENYRGKMEKIWGTKSIELDSQVKPALDLPVLLPVYYIVDDGIHAAVNGQTGKVSVRAEKESKYVEIPWWIKGLAVLIAAIGLTFSALWLGYRTWQTPLMITGMLSLFYIIVFACMFNESSNKAGIVTKYREIFTSGEVTFRREKGRLVLRDEVLKRKITDPVFMMELDGKLTRVTYRFRSFRRVMKMVLIALIITFLPVIVALILNGFDISAIKLSGSAVWFCLAVPIVPIYFILFGIGSIYAVPWVYTFTEDGKPKRYRRKGKARSEKIKNSLLMAIVPPSCFFVLGAIIIFAIMVYLTGFDS